MKNGCVHSWVRTQGPPDYESGTLTAELRGHCESEGIRTPMPIKDLIYSQASQPVAQRSQLLTDCIISFFTLSAFIL